MPKIIQLSEQIISKIAAGEVIERPVYAVKELVENAIDAEASSIIVHIEKSGLETITVIDDGVGMSAQDVETAIKPHTTSKLIDDEMLNQIKTLGFRGEALASIGAISNLTLSSKRAEDSVGTSISVENGHIVSSSPIGLPTGTHVTVHQLFSAVPARKKFLKTERTEFRHITDLLVQYALSYPQIRFVLTHNSKQILDVVRSETIVERLRLLLGNDVYEGLVPVSYEDSYTSISGFVARPQLSTKSGLKQFLFVNNRRVADTIVSLAVKESFGNMLENTSYPVFVLFLTLPYELVDVNVHPRKEQVRFVHSQQVYDAVRIGVGEALAKYNITFASSLFVEENNTQATFGGTKTYAADMLKDTVVPWDVRSTEKINSSDIVQVHNLYLLTQTTHGLVLVDQHAAHERILYEQFSQEFVKQKQKTPLFQLITPVKLDVSVSDAELITEYQEVLQRAGFTLEHFGGNTFLLVAVPLLFRDRAKKELLRELLDNLRAEKGVKHIDQISQRMLAYLACRSAVMAGEKLNKKQMKELVEKLETTPNHTTCPHGRPTKITVSLDRLHVLFKRK